MVEGTVCDTGRAVLVEGTRAIGADGGPKWAWRTLSKGKDSGKVGNNIVGGRMADHTEPRADQEMVVFWWKGLGLYLRKVSGRRI